MWHDRGALNMFPHFSHSERGVELSLWVVERVNGSNIREPASTVPGKQGACRKGLLNNNTILYVQLSTRLLDLCVSWAPVLSIFKKEFIAPITPSLQSIASFPTSSSPLLSTTLGKVALFYTFLRSLHAPCPRHPCPVRGILLKCDWMNSWVECPHFILSWKSAVLIRAHFHYFPRFIDDWHASSFVWNISFPSLSP